MRALLLEDDPATCVLYKECIEALGLDVTACTTIKHALKTLRTTQIDLLVIDLLIGDSNSLGLAQYAGYAAPNAEIILITGTNAFAHGEVMAAFPGITWLLRKPLPLSDLEAFVTHAHQRYASRNLDIAS